MEEKNRPRGTRGEPNAGAEGTPDLGQQLLSALAAVLDDPVVQRLVVAGVAGLLKAAFRSRP